MLRRIIRTCDSEKNDTDNKKQRPGITREQKAIYHLFEGNDCAWYDYEYSVKMGESVKIISGSSCRVQDMVRFIKCDHTCHVLFKFLKTWIGDVGHIIAGYTDTSVLNYMDDLHIFNDLLYTYVPVLSFPHFNLQLKYRCATGNSRCCARVTMRLYYIRAEIRRSLASDICNINGHTACDFEITAKTGLEHHKIISAGIV